MHTYEVDIAWVAEQKGNLSSPILPSSIETATPPPFPKGMPGIWSPEHLFLASLNSCLMTTFLAIADTSKLSFISFECKAKCTVEKTKDGFDITEIIMRPKLLIPSTQNPGRAKRIVEMSEKACLISKIIELSVQLEIEISIQ